jgi:hypothetical protein
MDMEYVLLTDNDDGTALIACPDQAAAEQVASAAVFNDGGVSAWRVPRHALTDWRRVRTALNEGGDCEYVLGLNLPTAVRE